MLDTPQVTFPAGARMHPSLRLLTWHPHGLLDATLADEILRFIDAEEGAVGEPFDRFTDLSGLRAVRLSVHEVEEIASRRVARYHGAPVKSAILAFSPFDFGIARMYEQLMRQSPIEVRVFCRLSSASKWLNVPIEVLASERAAASPAPSSPSPSPSSSASPAE